MAKYYTRFPDGSVYEFLHKTTRDDVEFLTRAEYLKARPEYCKRELQKLVQPGATVYCVLRHRSSSGMQRRISLFVMVDNAPRCIDQYAADILRLKNHDNGGIVVNGCGMDMGFHLVYSLSAALYGHDDRGAYNLKSAWL